MPLWIVILLACPQAYEPASPSPFDEVLELELTADSATLIDGRGPAESVQTIVEFTGSLHIWTRSELDLALRVEDVAEMSIVAADDDSGGGQTPYVALEVEAGDELAIVVSSPGEQDLGEFSLHLMAAPETKATREAAAAAESRYWEILRLRDSGQLADARALADDTVRTLLSVPDGDSSDVVSVQRWDHGYAAYELGMMEICRTAWLATRRHRDRTLPPDHELLLNVLQAIGTASRELGDPATARSLYEIALQGRLRSHPPGHMSVNVARHGLTNAMRDLGDYRSAIPHDRAVLESAARTLTMDDPFLFTALDNLARDLEGVGDHVGARALREEWLATYGSGLPEDHPTLLQLRTELAESMLEQGDYSGCRILAESVNESAMRSASGDPSVTLYPRYLIACSLIRMGEYSEGRALLEELVPEYRRHLPGELAIVQQVLATTIRHLGDLPAARALEEAVLETQERTRQEGHPALLLARANLANTLNQMGEHAAARELEQSVLEARERLLPVGHRDRIMASRNLAVTLLSMGDLSAARALVESQAREMQVRALQSLAYSPREARQVVAESAQSLGLLMALTSTSDAGNHHAIFELLETLRVVNLEAARGIRGGDDPVADAILKETESIRNRLNQLVYGETTRDSGSVSSELTRLVQERERLERKLSRRLVEKGVAARPIEVEPLARALQEDAAAIGFRRIESWGTDEGGVVFVGVDHLHAHLLRPDGSLVRIDLGPAAEIEALVAEWRPALGVAALRGLALGTDEDEGQEPATGERLRERLLDPILDQLGEETTRLHVCADDLVFLVPLDALPYAGGRLGDRWRILYEVSFARLLTPPSPALSEPGLFALGGVDYDDGGADPDALARNPGGSRGAVPDRFTPLAQTGEEARSAGALFEEFSGKAPVVRTRTEATKAAVFEHAPGKRFLHLATHGWFASEAVQTTNEEEQRSPTGHRNMDLEERVSDMAPMLLCGLALAGANREPGSPGGRSGILTAEELSGLDLTACELAVLSACETNVGVRRSGQGVQSLQAALYAAGARSSITSLWKVDDEATRRLMELFYTNLWEAKLPKAEALWQAKRALRDAGAPVHHWAGWVLTGDPH